MEITVIRGGMLTSVQDLGRQNHRSAGVPLSGAMDRFALRLANLLVGNDENSAGLECTLVGPELVFSADAVVAITGATFSDVPMRRPFSVKAGESLKLGAARSGCRGYIAIAGGIEVPSILDSRSTYLRAGLGGWEGRALRDGDVLPAAGSLRRVERHWGIDERILPPYSGNVNVRVLRGAHADEFGRVLMEAEFKVMPQSDRMGMRLGGPRLVRIGGAGEMVSSAVAPGTVQIPADGHPIVLMADAQTIGGYPQAAHVISVDLPLLAQLRAGDRLSFTETSLTEAHRLEHAREHVLAMLHEGLTQKVR